MRNMKLRSRSGGDKSSRIPLNSSRMYRLIAGSKSSVLSSMMRKASMRGGLLRSGSSWLVKAFLIQIMHCFSRVHRVVRISQAQKVWSMRRKN